MGGGPIFGGGSRHRSGPSPEQRAAEARAAEQRRRNEERQRLLEEKQAIQDQKNKIREKGQLAYAAGREEAAAKGIQDEQAVRRRSLLGGGM